MSNINYIDDKCKSLGESSSYCYWVGEQAGIDQSHPFEATELSTILLGIVHNSAGTFTLEQQTRASLDQQKTQ